MACADSPVHLRPEARDAHAAAEEVAAEELDAASAAHAARQRAWLAQQHSEHADAADAADAAAAGATAAAMVAEETEATAAAARREARRETLRSASSARRTASAARRCSGAEAAAAAASAIAAEAAAAAAAASAEAEAAESRRERAAARRAARYASEHVSIAEAAERVVALRAAEAAAAPPPPSRRERQQAAHAAAVAAVADHNTRSGSPSSRLPARLSARLLPRWRRRDMLCVASHGCCCVACLLCDIRFLRGCRWLACAAQTKQAQKDWETAVAAAAARALTAHCLVALPAVWDRNAAAAAEAKASHAGAPSVLFLSALC